MITVNNLSFQFGGQLLFKNVDLKFTPGNCYGIIGANGAGKSTFLKILSGQLEPSKGDVVITPGQRLSFLQQDHFKYDEYPVLDTVIMGNPRLLEVMHEKDAIYMKEDFTETDGIRAAELEEEFANMNGWEAESDAASLLNGLGIETGLHYSLMKDLGGNDKVKVLLVDVALGMTPSRQWLGKYDANGGYLVVRKDGEVVCYHFYNRNDIEDYLYYNTRFERASRSRYGFGSLYRGDDEQVYIKLNLQIRFFK